MNNEIRKQRLFCINEISLYHDELMKKVKTMNIHQLSPNLFKINNGNTRKMFEICLKVNNKYTKTTSLTLLWYLS